MDGLTQFAEHLKSARVTLAESNAADARTQRDRLETLLGEFIDCKGPFEALGGVCNLLTTIGMLCEERSRLEGDDFEKAAAACDVAAEECDLKYASAE